VDLDYAAKADAAQLPEVTPPLRCTLRAAIRWLLRFHSSVFPIAL
jgi:hypothetical protein